MICEEEIHPNIERIKVSRKGAEARIGDVKPVRQKATDPAEIFHKNLKYGSPARGKWTIAHSPMLIPECHEIYVCCPCCLQGVVLSAEEIPEGFGRFSMVTVTNENVLKGNLESMMIDGVTDIINGLPKRPKCVECFTSCIQHFLHIDLKVVYRTLSERFPDIDFIDGYMVPTLQRRFTPDTLGRRQLVRAVKPQPKKKAVNLAVNYYPTDPESELLTILRAGGYEVHDFAACPTYDEYQAMGSSVANLYFTENSEPAVLDMEKRLGQKPVPALYTWDPDEIGETYEKIADALGIGLNDERLQQTLCDGREKAERSYIELKEAIGDMPVAIDATATPRPFNLARVLLDHGIKVYVVYADVVADSDRRDYDDLASRYPEMLLRSMENYKMRLFPRDDDEKIGPVLAIGQKAAYFTGAERFVNMEENGGEFRITPDGAAVVGCEEAADNFRHPDPELHEVELYGFEGIVKLVLMMKYAASHPADVSRVIQVKAWGCRGDAPERARMLLQETSCSCPGPASERGN